MSIQSQIIKMVAEGVDNAVPAVSKVVKEAPDSARKALDEIADDWGWKGGKPGEITGNKWKRALDDYNAGRIGEREYDQLIATVGQQLDLAAKRGKPIGVDWQKKIDEIVNVLGEKGLEARYGAAENFMENFYILERAGVPRSMTGKLAPNMDNTLLANEEYVYRLRNPRMGGAGWKRGRQNEFSLDDYANAFKTVYSDRLKPAVGLSESQLDTYLKLLPEWSGSLEDLAKAARSL